MIAADPGRVVYAAICIHFPDCTDMEWEDLDEEEQNKWRAVSRAACRNELKLLQRAVDLMMQQPGYYAIVKGRHWQQT